MIGAAAFVPVPVSVMLKGLLVSLLTMCSAAIFTPVLVGAKLTIKLVLPPGITVATRVDSVKLAASAPLLVMPKIVRFAVPLFVMVKVRLVLVRSEERRVGKESRS